MRIISGEFGSRRLETLKGTATRPTLDKVKEAVFSSLGTYFDGGNALDVYAGCGAVGLEALSRGMDFVVLNDKSREAYGVIKANIQALDVKDRTKLYCMSDMKLLNFLKDQNMQFDLVYLDPPYAKEQNVKVMETLIDNNLLKDGAVVVVESLKEETFPEHVKGLSLYKEAVYGISRISYYRKESAV